MVAPLEMKMEGGVLVETKETEVEEQDQTQGQTQKGSRAEKDGK
jgi:hypothetical protein